MTETQTSSNSIVDKKFDLINMRFYLKKQIFEDEIDCKKLKIKLRLTIFKKFKLWNYIKESYLNIPTDRRFLSDIKKTIQRNFEKKKNQPVENLEPNIKLNVKTVEMKLSNNID